MSDERPPALLFLSLFSLFAFFSHLNELSLLAQSSPSGTSSRLVAEDLLDPLVQLGVNLGQHIEGLDVLLNLFGLGRAELSGTSAVSNPK
jgi:hypothetical protein